MAKKKYSDKLGSVVSKEAENKAQTRRGRSYLYAGQEKAFPLMAEGGTIEGEGWTSEDIGNPVYSKQSHRAVDQKARDERFRSELQQGKNDRFKDVVVPVADAIMDFSPVIGDAKSLAEAALLTKEGNYAMAALAGLGVFPGIPGYKRLSRLWSKPNKRIIAELDDALKIEDIAAVPLLPMKLRHMYKWYKAEGGAQQARKFSEMFPVLPWDVAKANKASVNAVDEGIGFVKDYYDNPDVKAKVDKILADNERHMPKERRDILIKEGIMDADGNVDIEKYMNYSPHYIKDSPEWLDEGAAGVHKFVEDGGYTATFDRNMLYYRDPKGVKSTAVHEQNHKMQEVLGFDGMSKYDPDSGYYVANTDHTLGRMFDEVSNKKIDDPWYKSPSELHSVLMELKEAKGIKPDEVISDSMLDKILDYDVMKGFFNVTEANKPKIKKLINALPAAAPVAGAAAVRGMMSSQSMDSYAGGGVVKEVDNYDIAFEYLTKDKNLKPEQAIAIMSNLDRESGLNPEITNSIGAFGIQQWLGSRKEKLLERYGEKPTLQQQLEFLVDEHKGKVKDAGWNYLNKGKNPGSKRFNYYMYSRSDFDNAGSVADAIIAWNQGFGRPATHELNNEGRLKAGMALAERFGVDFGENTYGQMGVGTLSSKTEAGGAKADNSISEVRVPYRMNEQQPNGVASYVPDYGNMVNSVIPLSEKEPEETAYAKKVRERAETLQAKKIEDQAKMDFFNQVWNGISLRRRNKT